LNCQAAETGTFPRPEVRQELDKFVFVKLYVDKPAPEGPANQKLRDERFQSNDLPLYVILDENGKEISRQNYAALDAAEFVQFLKEAQADALASQ
jgi:thiol:disulfide interchange protein